MKSNQTSPTEGEPSKMIDHEIALGWLSNPPKLPPSENPLDAAYPQIIWIKKSLSELVTVWDVSAFEAEKVFQSWALARRMLRRLWLVGQRAASKEEEMQAAIRSEFWGDQLRPISARLQSLAEDIYALEQQGKTVSPEWVIWVLSDPGIADSKHFLRWLIRHWILPEKGKPPLCLCSDSVILEIADSKRDPFLKWRSSDNALRRSICDHGLYRPKGRPRIRKDWQQL